MTPETIIAEAQKAGVRLALTPTGTIKARGDEEAVSRWLPIIREQKPGLVEALRSAGPILIEPATKPDGSPLSPVYWETGDGRILGPAVSEFLAREGDCYWIVTTFAGGVRWINADRLKSRKAFEQQAPLLEVEPIQF